MLKGKNAIITGSGRGIGKAIALKLASLGANVVINYYSNFSEACSLMIFLSQPMPIIHARRLKHWVLNRYV